MPRTACQSCNYKKEHHLTRKNAVFQAPRFPFTFGIITQRQSKKVKKCEPSPWTTLISTVCPIHTRIEAMAV